MALNYFQVESDLIKKVGATFDRSEKSLSEDVEIIKKWIQTQPHLPEILDDRSILNFLFLCKCSIEKTKQRIDMYYTLRSKIPDQFANSNPKNVKMQEIIDDIYWFPLPKLTQEMYRVIIFKVRNNDLMHDLNPLDVHKLLINIQEIRLHEDVMFRDIYIFDFRGLSVDYLLRVTPTVIYKLVAVYEQIYSLRIKKCLIIDAPAIFNVVLATIKKLLKDKIFARFQLIKSDELMNYVPKEILPRDYGGEEKSLEELKNLMKIKYKEYEARFDLLETLKSNEELRPGGCINDEMLGFYGNFKKLDVD